MYDNIAFSQVEFIVSTNPVEDAFLSRGGLNPHEQFSEGIDLRLKVSGQVYYIRPLFFQLITNFIYQVYTAGVYHLEFFPLPIGGANRIPSDLSNLASPFFDNNKESRILINDSQVRILFSHTTFVLIAFFLR